MVAEAEEKIVLQRAQIGPSGLLDEVRGDPYIQEGRVLCTYMVVNLTLTDPRSAEGANWLSR